MKHGQTPWIGLEQRTDCPICGGELRMPVHQKGGVWHPKEIAMARRMLAAGIGAKATARLFGVSTSALSYALAASLVR